MKDKILNIATDLFINYGFKSVTMDDIAHNMGISKKTIYQHYPNKTKLIEASTICTSNIINKGINRICKLNKNPIEEVFEIKTFVMKHIKNENASPQYQLQKYYPKIFEKLKKKKFKIMTSCVKENLTRGISENLYRDSIDINFIATIYFYNILLLKDQKYFSAKEFSISELMDHYLEYHLRGLCTPKGLKILNKIIDKK